jgi:hypothetical protein
MELLILVRVHCLSHFLAQLIAHLGELHSHHDWEQLMLIENNKILRKIAETKGIDVTTISGIGATHPPPPAPPTIHMTSSPGLGISNLALDDAISNTSSRSRSSARSEEPGEYDHSNLFVSLIVFGSSYSPQDQCAKFSLI